MLPMDEVQIEILCVSNIDLGKSISSKQLDEFAAFQDSQGTQRAYLVETAELVFKGRNKHGEWGLALGSQAQASKIDIIRICHHHKVPWM
jgi:hypothetical protein